MGSHKHFATLQSKVVCTKTLKLENA